MSTPPHAADASAGEPGGPPRSPVPRASGPLLDRPDPSYMPTFRDVLEARARIRPHLKPTPLLAGTALDQRLGFRAYVKCENLQPVGAFKVRGGVNLMAALPAEIRRRGVVAASTGNHGQSVAYAARLFGVEATIFAPAGANPLKVSAMERLGARVRLEGRDFDEAREAAEAFAAETGARYVHSMNEPLLIAGVATAYLEALEEAPEIETILVPVGGGSGASGACLAAKTVDPSIRVIAVQAEGAPAAYRSWRSGRLERTEQATTVAEGLATRVAFELPMAILRRDLDDFVLVSDQEMQAAIGLLAETTHQVAEEAGAAATAGALKLSQELRGRRVLLPITGGNLSVDQLRRALAAS